MAVAPAAPTATPAMASLPKVGELDAEVLSCVPVAPIAEDVVDCVLDIDAVVIGIDVVAVPWTVVVA